MESKTKNKKTREQIESMAVRAFNGLGLAAGEEAVLELKEGWFNAAYQVRLASGREVILKIAPPKGAEVLTYEKNIMLTENLRLTPSIAGEWRSKERVDYYYGVHSDEILPSRPAYTGKATVNMNAGLASVYYLQHWNLLGGVFMTSYGKGIVDSPIVTRNVSTLVFLGAGWSF